MEYADCKKCSGYDKNCFDYISFSDYDEKCLYHRYREQEHGSIFQWKQNISKLEKICGEYSD